MVNVEVQFRTIAMDFWASLDHKIRYKKELSDEEVEILQEELYDCAEQSAALDERMQRIRDRITQKREKEATSWKINTINVDHFTKCDFLNCNF